MSRSAGSRALALGTAGSGHLCAPDAGFSFVELLVALSLLLITLVAVVGLATTSSFMAGAARQRAAMVNAAAGYLERVRQEPYANVGTPGGDPAGTLLPVLSTSAPYTVSITPQVTWGRPEDPANRDFKTVTLAVSSVNARGGSLMTYSTAAVFADTGAVSGAASAVATPSISISAPPDGSVVHGAAVSVTASATANPASRSLVWLELIDGSTSWGSIAVTGSSAQHTYTWNTTFTREGRHKLTPRVTDSTLVTVDGAPITVTVDNAAPGQPGSLAAAFPTATGGQLWWNAAIDGTDVDGTTPLAASHYMVSAFMQPSSASIAGEYTQWTPVPGLTGLSVPVVPSPDSPLTLPGLVGFSRYGLTVRASSPDRGAVSGLLSAPATVVGVTKSTASGTWQVSYANKKYAIDISVSVPSGPSFPWTGDATTRIYRLTSPTQAISTGLLLKTTSATSPTWVANTATDNQVTATNGTPVPYYYGAITTLTPAGYAGVSTLVSSCVLGPPVGMTSVGTQQLVIAQW